MKEIKYEIWMIVDPINSQDRIKANKPLDYITITAESGDQESIEWLKSLLEDRFVQAGPILKAEEI